MATMPSPTNVAAARAGSASTPTPTAGVNPQPSPERGGGPAEQVHKAFGAAVDVAIKNPNEALVPLVQDCVAFVQQVQKMKSNQPPTAGTGPAPAGSAPAAPPAPMAGPTGVAATRQAAA